jgi:hypothetical protein
MCKAEHRLRLRFSALFHQFAQRAGARALENGA